MNRLLHYRLLSRRDRILFHEALIGVFVARIVVRLRTIDGITAYLRGSARSSRDQDDDVVTRVRDAMRRARRAAPRARCLALATAGAVLLGRRGVDAAVHVGVSSADHAVVRAHAWLECGGRIITGDGGDLPEFREIYTLYSLPRENGSATPGIGVFDGARGER